MIDPRQKRWDITSPNVTIHELQPFGPSTPGLQVHVDTCSFPSGHVVSSKLDLGQVLQKNILKVLPSQNKIILGFWLDGPKRQAAPKITSLIPTALILLIRRPI